MLLQRTSYDCGPAAIVNACLAMGREHDIGEVAKLAGTSIRGTDEKGISRALSSLGYGALELQPKGAERASELWTLLHGALTQGEAVILCVDGVDHWVAAIGTIGSRVVVFDSERARENLTCNGVHVYDEREFVERLGGSRYAIRVVADAYRHVEPTSPQLDSADAIAAALGLDGAAARAAAPTDGTDPFTHLFGSPGRSR